MPQLDAVVEQKTAGFVDTSSNRARRQAKLDKEEEELAKLIAGETSENDDDEEDNPPEETIQTKQQNDEDNSHLSAEEKTFKQRYGDVRKHLAEKEKEYQARIEELETRLKKGPQGIRPPKSDEDIEQWASQYPDVASIVETIAAKKAKELFSKAESRFQELDRIQYETERNQSENRIRSAHSDFDQLRDSDKFHNWAAEQPKWVQDALYENSDDPDSVIRVIDLYKVDNGKTPSDYKKKAKEAAKTVTKGQRTKVDADGSEGVFRESQVAKMSAKEYEANAEAIDESIRAGKFVYDLSGGAR